MKYKLVMFDMDGTVLDTLGDISDSLNHILKMHGMPERKPEDIRLMLGDGMEMLIRRAAPAGTADDKIQEILKDYKPYYGAHADIKTKPYDGICKLLEDLRSEGLKVCVVSNKADYAVQPLSEKYFNGLLDASAGENVSAGIAKKPHPAMCYKMMEQFGVSPSESVYIGDSEVDIQTAKNGNMDCIVVSWGFRDIDFLKENGAETIVSTPSEIFDIITQSRP